jgi:hypothetical protein
MVLSSASCETIRLDTAGPFRFEGRRRRPEAFPSLPEQLRRQPHCLTQELSCRPWHAEHGGSEQLQSEGYGAHLCSVTVGAPERSGNGAKSLIVGDSAGVTRKAEDDTAGRCNCGMTCH